MNFSLERALAQATPGATIVVPAGTHVGHARLSSSVILKGEPGAILQGTAGHGILRIEGEQTVVELVGLTLTTGVAEAGGLIHHDEGSLRLVECTLERGVAHDFGGGALFSCGDALTVSRCRFLENQGRQGGAVLLTAEVEASFSDCVFSQNASLQGGAIRVRDGVKLLLNGCTFVDNRGLAKERVTAAGASLWCSGTSSRRPSVVIQNSVFRSHVDSVSGDVFNDAEVPATLSVLHSLLAPRDAAFAGKGCSTAPVRVETSGRPLEFGVLHIADRSLFTQQVDLVGTPRGTTAGAFEG
jgi:hypothetical protein